MRLINSSIQGSLVLLGLLWIGACAETANRTEWIRDGVTTQHEVIQRYGEPDFVMTLPDGSIATYRPVVSMQPTAQIPTVQPGPLGTTTTTMKPVEPGLGRGDIGGTHHRPAKEIHIRYNAQGIVQEVRE